MIRINRWNKNHISRKPRSALPMVRKTTSVRKDILGCSYGEYEIVPLWCMVFDSNQCEICKRLSVWSSDSVGRVPVALQPEFEYRRGYGHVASGYTQYLLNVHTAQIPRRKWLPFICHVIMNSVVFSEQYLSYLGVTHKKVEVPSVSLPTHYFHSNMLNREISLTVKK